MNAIISPKTVAMGTPMMHLTRHVAEALPAPTHAATDQVTRAIWTEAQAMTLASLQRVVNEGGVFGAVTGPKLSGKSAIMKELLAGIRSKKRVCIDIQKPDTVSTKTTDDLLKTLDVITDRSSSDIEHILITIDNAHTSSRELLALLSRLAAERSSFGSPQVILAGEPTIWNRLAVPEYEKLLWRIALRCSSANPEDS